MLKILQPPRCPTVVALIAEQIPIRERAHERKGQLAKGQLAAWKRQKMDPQADDRCRDCAVLHSAATPLSYGRCPTCRAGHAGLSEHQRKQKLGNRPQTDDRCRDCAVLHSAATPLSYGRCPTCKALQAAADGDQHDVLFYSNRCTPSKPGELTACKRMLEEIFKLLPNQHTPTACAIAPYLALQGTWSSEQREMVLWFRRYLGPSHLARLEQARW
jgi:hypothetical protein